MASRSKGAWLAGALLAVIGSMACAESAPAVRPSEPLDESQLPVKPVSPAVGTPSYDDTMAWFTSHARLHLSILESFSPVRATASTKVFQSKWPCVLGEVQSVKLRNPNDHFMSYEYFVNLSLLEAVELARAKENPLAWCVNMKGRVGFSVKVDKNGAGEPPTISVISTDSLCFDSEENAKRASNALGHLGELCGATAKKEPF